MKKFSLLILTFLSLSACFYSKETSQTRFALHTMVKLTLFNGESSSLFDDFYNELEAENSLVSNWISGSYASQVSNLAGIKPVSIAEERILRLLKRSIQFSRESGGRFNILVAPLTYLWGIGTENPYVPSSKEIEEVLELLDLDKVIVKGNSVFLEKEGMSLDLGALGKGYLIDHMENWLKNRGIKKAIIDLGGNIFLLGCSGKNKEWKIGIRKPHAQAQSYIATLTVAPNQAISTSGSYERYFEKSGKLYHHILDTVTGYPVEGDLAFVTTVLSSGLEADYYSTLGLLLGLKEGVKLMCKKQVPSIFVTKQGEIHLVNINSQEFNLLDDSYKIIQ